MNGDFDKPLLGDYHLLSTSAHQVQVMHMTDSDNPGIPPKVVEIGWNKSFIIAKQQRLKERGDFPGDKLLVPVPSQFAFWIVSVGKTNRYGPLSEKEFNEKLEALSQKELRLKPLSEVRWQ